MQKRYKPQTESAHGAAADHAIARVLEAERQAVEMLDAVKRDALGAVENARLRAGAIGARAHRRIAAVQQAFEQHVEAHRIRTESQIEALLRAGHQGEGQALADPAAIVRALVAQLTGDVDD
jgi:vacuolar-type H+-ATPase subunit H